MTYCICWKTSNIAFLIADGAITSDKSTSDSITSFGERAGNYEIGNVQQSALKIYRIGNIAYTFSGNVKLGKSIKESYEDCLNAGISPYEAFSIAINSNLPIPNGERFQCSTAFFDSSAKIYEFDSGISTDINLTNLVQLGSLTPSLSALPEHLVTETLKKMLAHQLF